MAKVVALEEFQRLAGLSDASLVWLLHEGGLPLRLDPDGLKVVAEEVTIEKLLSGIATAKSDARSSQRDSLVQRVGRIMVSHFGKILQEALAEIPKK